jgi:hypothetical protein
MTLAGAFIALAVVPIVLFWPVWQNAAGASIAVAALSAGVIPPLYAGRRRRR